MLSQMARNEILSLMSLMNVVNVVVMTRIANHRVPTRTGKPGKWEGIFQSGKSRRILNRLEKSGEIAQSTGKLR